MTSDGTHQEFKGTQTAPIPIIPIKLNMYSGLFCMHIATLSPFLIPEAIKALATCADRS